MQTKDILEPGDVLWKIIASVNELVLISTLFTSNFLKRVSTFNKITVSLLQSERSYTCQFGHKAKRITLKGNNFVTLMTLS